MLKYVAIGEYNSLLKLYYTAEEFPKTLEMSPREVARRKKSRTNLNSWSDAVSVVLSS